jgi:uncharacterized ferritin-like protein (DUF455 family)
MMINYPLIHHLESIFWGSSLEEKLYILSYDSIDWSQLSAINGDVPSHNNRLQWYPGRSSFLLPSPKQIKFPSPQFLEQEEKRAITLHAFANHELQAIELMAFAILFYPHHTQELIHFKKQLYLSLCDEQKHFQLYIQRIQQLGYQFGDFPINDFFLRYLPSMNTPSQFVAMMNLTFEQANLDFAFEYQQHFLKIQDLQSSQILEQVLKDEIVHVKRGAKSLNDWRQISSPSETCWDYYCSQLPPHINPDRAKGKYFQKQYRLQAGLDEHFIEQLSQHRGSFAVTKRKSWPKYSTSIT